MPYSNLLRGRWSCPGCFYLLTTVTVRRAPLFTDFSLGAAAASELARMQQSGVWEILAWVLMPDHLHILLDLRDGSLSNTARQFKGRSAHRINAMRKAGGPVWQRGYHDHAVRKDEDLVEIARYVVANPLRAGLVKKIADYPFWNAVYLDM